VSPAIPEVIAGRYLLIEGSRLTVLARAVELYMPDTAIRAVADDRVTVG
jgi:hypothetical protein